MTTTNTFEWHSRMCACCATGNEDGIKTLSLCDLDHEPWASVIALEGFAEARKKQEVKRREINTAIRLGYGNEFSAMLERWEGMGQRAGVFFREATVDTVLDGLSPDMAMYVLETHGVQLDTNDGERMTTLLQGKAILGLMETMWREDRNSPPGQRCTFPEELVIEGLMGFKTAEAIWNRELNGNLLWLFGHQGFTKIEDVFAKVIQ